MLCPGCREEIDDTSTVCPECGASLVGEAPPAGEDGYANPVTVFVSSDPVRIAMAQSLLAGENIRFFAKNEVLTSLFPGQFNPMIGPVEIQVDGPDAEDARRLLALLDEPEETDDHGVFPE